MTEKPKQIVILQGLKGDGHDVFLLTPSFWNKKKMIKILKTSSIPSLSEVVRFYGWMNTTIGSGVLNNQVKAEMDKR